jgi:hypothetical protein
MVLGLVVVVVVLEVVDQLILVERLVELVGLDLAAQ